MPIVTLSTYTYNDANLVHGLLENVRSWSRAPDEILITDDGSDLPFTLDRTPEPPFPPVRIQRLPRNRGFAVAKQAGIDASSGDVVFSVDCDARPQPDYLKRCLEHLEDANVGMVSGCCLVDAGGGSLGLYVRLFGDNYLVRETGPVDFIPGVAFALRKAVWNEVNGFAGHGRATCEDHALCAKLKAKGYRLIMDKGIRTIQTRRLSRHAQCRRLWLWCGPALLAGTDNEAPLSDQFMAWYVLPLLERIRICIERNCPEVIYHDLLHIIYAAFAVCRELAGTGRIPSASARVLVTVLEKHFVGHPLVWSLLKRDLIALGALPLPQSGESEIQSNTTTGNGRARSPLWESAADWATPFAFLGVLSSSGTLSLLNDAEAPRLLAEDKIAAVDFSSYHPQGKPE